MLSTKRSNNPFLKGISPKRFLANRDRLMRDNKRVRDVRVFNPDWAKDRKRRA